MMIRRRALLMSSTFVPTAWILAACSTQQASTVQTALQTGILDTGLITTSLSTVEADIKADDPTLITPAQDAQFQTDLAALEQANTSLSGLGGNPLPSSAQTPLQQFITGFNDFASIVDAVLPAAAVAVPALQPVVVTFQAATLIMQTVIEPLMTQIAANQTAASAPMQPTAVVHVAARFTPPASMTLDQARAILLAKH